MRTGSGTVVAGAAAAALALAGCVIDVEGYEAEETEEYVFVVGGVPDVDLSTFEGRIEVRGWDRSEVRVVVQKRAANRERLEEIEIETLQSGGRVRVAARRGTDGVRVSFSMRGNRQRARLIASVPYESNLVARTDDSRITVAGITGTIEVAADDGRIQGERLRGAVSARTDDGAVRLLDVDGDVAVHADDGSITVSGVLTGLEASTDDGRIAIEAAPGSAMSRNWDVDADDGRVTLDLPRDFSAELDLAVDNGRIRVDDHFGGGADRGDERLRRSIGAGGFELRVRTDDGSIRIGTSGG